MLFCRGRGESPVWPGRLIDRSDQVRHRLRFDSADVHPHAWHVLSHAGHALCALETESTDCAAMARAEHSQRAGGFYLQSENFDSESVHDWPGGEGQDDGRSTHRL